MSSLNQEEKKETAITAFNSVMGMMFFGFFILTAFALGIGFGEPTDITLSFLAFTGFNLNIVSSIIGATSFIGFLFCLRTYCSFLRKIIPENNL